MLICFSNFPLSVRDMTPDQRPQCLWPYHYLCHLSIWSVYSFVFYGLIQLNLYELLSPEDC